MEEFLLFLKDNWKFLVELLLLVISFVVLLFKKKIKIKIPSSVLSQLLANIPSLINEAEKLLGPGEGNQKLKYVFKAAVDFISNETDLSCADVIRVYGNCIYEQIEDILSTPQKKGD